jgi:hypothetical protein
MEDTPPGTVLITARDLYSEVQAMHSELRGIREDIRVMMATLPDHKSMLDDHETRIRLVERKVLMWATAAAVAGGGLGQAISTLTGA